MFLLCSDTATEACDRQVFAVAQTLFDPPPIASHYPRHQGERRNDQHNLDLGGPSATDIIFSGNQATLSFYDQVEFTGSLAGFTSKDRLVFPNQFVRVSYGGTASGGTLTIFSGATVANIDMVGDYTSGTFVVFRGNQVIFKPSAATTSLHTDSFDFGVPPRAATDANVASLHGGHSTDVAFTHDATQAMHAHGLAFQHFTHDLFAHAHGFAEALL